MKLGLIIGFTVIGLFLVGILGYLIFLPTTYIKVSPIVVVDIPGAGLIQRVPEVIFIAVTGISPPDLAISQDIEQSIIVTFDEAIDSTTINDNTFTLRGPNDLNLKGQINSDSTGKIWTFNPNQNLKLNTKYQIKISQDIKGISGNNLVEDFLASFTTVVAQR